MVQFIAGIAVALFFSIVVAVAYVAGLHDRRVKPTLFEHKALQPSEDERAEQQREAKRMRDFEALMSYSESKAIMRAGE